MSASTEPLQVVILGGGLISDTHARAVRQVGDARLLGFVGHNRSREQAARFGVCHFTDLVDAARHGAQVAVVCTPSETHAERGITAARLGLHVLVEKPIDLSLDAARRLVRACAAHDVTLAVVSQRRFDPGFTELAALVHGERLGRLTLGSAAMKCWRDDAYYHTARHGADGLGGGGALINQGIHAVDMLCKVMGPAVWVSALRRSIAHDIDVEDVALATIEFRNGAVGTIEATTAFYSAISGPTVANAVERLEIAGTAGSAILSAGRLTHCSLPAGDLPIAVTPAASSALPLEPFRLQHQDFITAVRARRKPAVTGADGVNALAVVAAVYESARRHAPVRIDKEED